MDLGRDQGLVAGLGSRPGPGVAYKGCQCLRQHLVLRQMCLLCEPSGNRSAQGLFHFCGVPSAQGWKHSPPPKLGWLDSG